MENEILNFRKDKLNKTQTKFTRENGKQTIENIYTNEFEKEIEPPNSDQSKNNNTEFVTPLFSDIYCDNIIPNLFLSSDSVARNYDILKLNNITHIVNITLNIKNYFTAQGILYMNLMLFDNDTQNIIEHFEKAFDFIDDALEGKDNNVLVHCNQGVSRSASFIIGYLLRKGIYRNYEDAYEHVRKCRPIISPNENFVKQLRQYQNMLYDNV